MAEPEQKPEPAQQEAASPVEQKDERQAPRFTLAEALEWQEGGPGKEFDY